MNMSKESLKHISNKSSKEKENKKYVYVVLSQNYTVSAKLIMKRAESKFGVQDGRYSYGHVSLSLDKNLKQMISFARFHPYTPFLAGLVKESFDTGVFAKKIKSSKIAVIKIQVTEEQYNRVKELVDEYWEKRRKLRYNFFGLFYMLFTGKGLSIKNCYVCSHWIAEVLKNSGVDMLEGIEPYNVRPFDYYVDMKDKIIYEGYTWDYVYNGLRAV